MTPQEFLDEFGTLAESAEGVPKLRELILQLAMRGRLTAQVEPSRDSTKSPSNELPEGWTQAPLGEVARLRRGFDLPRQKRKPGSVPIFAANGTVGTHSEVGVEGPGVVTGRSGTIGKVHYVAEDYWPLNTSLYVEDFHGNDPQFITLLLRSVDLKRFSSYSAVPTLNRNVAHKEIVPVPPLAEQHRIVSKVDELMGLCDRLEAVQGERRGVRVRLNRSSLDRLTSSSTARGSGLSAAWQRVCDHFEVLYDTPETLPDLRQTILQLAVQGKLVPQDPNDEPAANAIAAIAAEKEKLYKAKEIKRPKPIAPITDDERNGLPSTWEAARLAGLVNPRFTITYGVLVPGPDTPGGIPFVRINDLDTDNPPELPAKSISPEVDAQYERTRVVGGEILLGVVGSIGKLGLAPASWAGANIARAVCRIMAADQIDRQFLLLALRSPPIQQHFLSTTRTLAQPTLNVGLIEATVIPVPPLSEQKRIVSKVTHLLSQVTRLESTLTRRESTRTQLLTAAIHSILCGGHDG